MAQLLSAIDVSWHQAAGAAIAPAQLHSLDSLGNQRRVDSAGDFSIGQHRTYLALLLC